MVPSTHCCGMQTILKVGTRFGGFQAPLQSWGLLWSSLGKLALTGSMVAFAHARQRSAQLAKLLWVWAAQFPGTASYLFRKIRFQAWRPNPEGAARKRPGPGISDLTRQPLSRPLCEVGRVLLKFSTEPRLTALSDPAHGPQWLPWGVMKLSWNKMVTGLPRRR